MEGYALSFAGKAAARELANRPATQTLAATGDWDPATPARHVLLAGDNLEAMRVLQPAYGGAVDCIYIDPPYNTGRDFVYRDRWAQSETDYLHSSGQADAEGNVLVANPVTSGRYHSAWLSMMLPRLQLAHRLLADDGVLFVSIDDHEVANLRLLLDEVFGADCFVAQIVIVSNRGGRDYLRIATTHEYLLCYGRSPDAAIRELPRPAAASARTDARGTYELRELRNRNPKFSPANRPNLAYPIWVDPDARDDDTCAVTLQPHPGCIEVLPLSSTGAGSVWRWGRPKLAAAIVAGDPAASEVVARQGRNGWRIFEKSRKATTKARSVWDDPALRSERGTQALRALLGATVFDHPKPVELVARCLQLGMDRDGLALDFFAGSGTLAHAATWLDAEDGGRRRTLSINLDEPVPEGSPAAAAGHATIADIARTRITAALPEGETLRTFALATCAPDGDPWAAALAGGAGLDGVPQRLGPDTWRFADAEGRGHVVHLGTTLTREQVQSWSLPSRARLTCRGDALTDTLALNLGRNFVLSLL